MLSNGLIAFSGGIMAQYQGFSDASMGIGTLILGIASIIIGTSIIKRKSFIKETSMVIIGTIIYQGTIYLAMTLGLTTVDLKMITSLIIIVFLALREIDNKYEEKVGGGLKMLEIKNLSKSFHNSYMGENKLFYNLNLTINEGDFVSIIGSNGTGKSTLLNILSGVVKETSGNIILKGVDITKLPEHKRTKL